MKHIILPSTNSEFKWLVIDGFMEENGLGPPLPKMKLGSQNIDGPQEIWNRPSLQLQDTIKNWSPQKKYLWVGGLYTMGNNGKNTDYQQFVRVGDRKWEIVEITIGTNFFA